MKPIPFFIVVLAIVMSGCIVSDPYATPTPSPTPATSPTPMPTISPAPANGSSSNASLVVNASPPSPTPAFVDPLSPPGYQQRMNNYNVPQNPDYVPGHPETIHGYFIYSPPSPTPTPVPADDPFRREKHTTVYGADVANVPQDIPSSTPGILAWDSSKSRGLYPYYYQGDHIVLELRFVNDKYNAPIVDPEVIVYLKMRTPLGFLVDVDQEAWYLNTTVPAAKLDPDTGQPKMPLPSTTLIWEHDVPKTYTIQGYQVDTQGSYQLEVDVYTHDGQVRCCQIIANVAIFSK